MYLSQQAQDFLKILSEDRERKKKRQRILYLLIHGHNWTKQKPGASIFLLVFCVSAGAQAPEPFSAAFPGTSTRSGKWICRDLNCHSHGADVAGGGVVYSFAFGCRLSGPLPGLLLNPCPCGDASLLWPRVLHPGPGPPTWP